MHILLTMRKHNINRSFYTASADIRTSTWNRTSALLDWHFDLALAMRRHRPALRIFLDGGDGFFAALLAPLVVLMFLVTLDLNGEFRRLEADSAGVLANVVKLVVDSSGDETEFLVYYAFHNDDVWIEGAKAASWDFYNRLSVEDQIPIRFVPEDPSVVEIEPGSLQQDLFASFAVLLSFCATAALLFRNALRRVLHIVRLARHGVPVEARVTGHGPVSDNEGSLTVTAFWIRPDGQKGSTGSIPVAQAPSIGDRITILTDPSGKRQSLWEGQL